MPMHAVSESQSVDFFIFARRMWQDRKNVNTAVRLYSVAVLTHSTHGCARTRARSLTFMSLLKITELVRTVTNGKAFVV